MRSLREVRDSLLAREKKRIAVAAAEDRPVLEADKRGSTDGDRRGNSLRMMRQRSARSQKRSSWM